MRQLASNPWDTCTRSSRWRIVEGRVRNLTDFGAFIEIEDGIDGLVHVSNLSWTKRVKHPSEVLKKGERSRPWCWPSNRTSAAFAGREAAAARCLGDLLRAASRRRRGARQGAARGDASARSLRSLKASKACATTRRRSMRTAQPVQPGTRPGVRLQDHQDESGRKEGGTQHPCGGRRSHALRKWRLTSIRFRARARVPPSAS